MAIMTEPKRDRHKRKGMQLRLHPLMRQQLDLLVERNVSTLSAEIIAAIREKLAREGLWPPPQQPSPEPEGR